MQSVRELQKRKVTCVWNWDRFYRVSHICFKGMTNGKGKEPEVTGTPETQSWDLCLENND